LNGTTANDTNIYNSRAQYAVVDTSARFILMAEADYNAFTAMVTKASSDFNCTSTVDAYCFSTKNTCNTYWDVLVPITISLSNSTYTIMPEGYTLSDEPDIPCAIGISSLPNTSNMYVLGEIFMRNFITTFNYKDNTVSFAVNVNAPVGTKATSLGPSPPNPEKKLDIIKLSLACALGLLVLILILFFGWKYYKYKTRPPEPE